MTCKFCYIVFFYQFDADYDEFIEQCELLQMMKQQFVTSRFRRNLSVSELLDFGYNESLGSCLNARNEDYFSYFRLSSCYKNTHGIRALAAYIYKAFDSISFVKPIAKCDR